MTEDEIYRASTQYRLWSFTPELLLSLRSTTNSLAADGVRTAISTRNVSQAKAEASGTGDGDSNREVDCLTVEEEQKLVGFYCIKTMEFADFCDFPTNVKATAVQYLKRFYLSNSPMTYHPKEMMPSALYLATKTENHYTSLRSFVSKLKKIKAEDVIAPEFLLTQGLRFTFDVRHPQRGLEGGFMELLALANGQGHASSQVEISSDKLQKDLLDIDPVKEGKPKPRSAEDVVLRIQNAHGRAKEILKTSALLTDAYFLYTPSQIWFSSLIIADEPLAHFYLKTKFPLSSDLKTSILSHLRQCCDLLRSSVSAKPGDVEMRELTRIDKKLYKCRNPEKIDLVGINKAQKRDGEGKGEHALDERTIKKRKLERENSMKEAEEVFGPAL
ncbi:hypothetical protein MMC07_003900 [Pseudocyphellaria aurata]|nr:hypothetical protein [Pseudocyphellaria aurata]